jgi:hypothetical protein
VHGGLGSLTQIDAVEMGILTLWSWTAGTVPPWLTVVVTPLQALRSMLGTSKVSPAAELDVGW